MTPEKTRLKVACPKCSGTVYFEETQWRCEKCGFWLSATDANGQKRSAEDIKRMVSKSAKSAPPKAPPIAQGEAAAEKQSEENRAKLFVRMQTDYIRGTHRVIEGFEEHSLHVIGEGLEVLYQVHQLSCAMKVGYLEPWKLVHAVSCHVLDGDALEKHLFLYQNASRGNPEMSEFIARIAADGPDEYIDEVFQRVSGANREQPSKQDKQVEPTIHDPLLGEITVGQKKIFDLVSSSALKAQRPGDLEEEMEERQRQSARNHNEACKLLDEGKHDEALRRFLAAIECDPTLLKPYLGAAQAFVLVGDLAQAVKHVETAVAMAPEDQHVKVTAFEVYVSNANKHIRAEEWVEVVDWCRKAILICPDDPDATNIFNIMFNTWDEKPGCVEPVLAACRAIVAKCPQWNYARYKLGRILLDTNNAQESIPILREAVQREPTNTEYRDWLCLALLQVGQGDAAMEQFRILQDVAPARAEEFKQVFREVAIKMLRTMRATDPERAKEFQKKLGPGFFDPADCHNN